MKNFFNSKKWAGLLALTYVPLEPLNNASATTYNSLSAYLNLVFNILLSIGGMIAVVTLVLGGITYMVSEIVDKKSEARKRMQAAIIGLLLLLGCWLILHEINPNLTQFSLLNLPGQTAATAPAPAATVPSNINAGTSGTPSPTNDQIAACTSQGKTIQYPDTNGWICQ